MTAQIDADGRRVLVVGAGGSSRAVVEALGRAGAEVTVASRREPGWPPSAEGYDILVNATPVKEELIVAPHQGMEVVDLAYLPDGRDTALLAAARAAGCDVVVDGLDVLLFQGAASFERWTGLRLRSSRCAKPSAAPDPSRDVKPTDHSISTGSGGRRDGAGPPR